MRALLCVNPTAGSKGYDKDALLAALKLADIDVRDVISVKSEDLAEALKKSADFIVAAGGDGTIGKVLTNLPDRSVPVALFPLGTANNAARSLGIAGTPQELVETWKIENTRPLDIGSVKGSWGTTLFLEAFGVGLIPDLLRLAAKGKKPEGADNLRKGRQLLQKALKDAKPIEIEIMIDGKQMRGEFLGVEVLNIPFTGPALPLGSKADVADGKLDVICFEADQRKALIDWLGAPLDEKPPVLYRKAEKVVLTWADAPNRIDDKFFENKDSKQVAEIICEPDQVHIIVPLKHPAQVAQQPKAKSA
ncbi:MAG TPA: diacylglycerol kinase family protein [Pseudolabrys sp.]|jgi:diacylglycerol kinase family enzyme|nr:diacylglycerol kinase family protein [Pseudolabrys sp.]